MARTFQTLCIFVLLFSRAIDALQGSSTSGLRKLLEDFYSKERNVYSPDNYEEARRDILKHFEDIDDKFDNEYVKVEQQNFTHSIGSTQYKAWNCILYMMGKNSGTSNDKPALIGAHYDTFKGTAGVDDNGSGMVALMTVAEIVADGLLESKEERPENTLIFVAFDMEEQGLGGSANFVKVTMEKFLKDNSISSDNFQGALILETIMNFNSTTNSQTLPPNSESIFPEAFKQLSNNSFRGNFLSLLHRIDDSPLVTKVLTEWKGRSDSDDMKYKLFNISLPASASGRPSTWAPQTYAATADFLRSDHQLFWDSDSPGTTGLKALFITDTANFRGYMKQCYHKPCDTLDKVTDESLEFLSMTTDVMAATMLKMGGIDITIEPVSSGTWSTLSSGLLHEYLGSRLIVATCLGLLHALVFSLI